MRDDRFGVARSVRWRAMLGDVLEEFDKVVFRFPREDDGVRLHTVVFRWASARRFRTLAAVTARPGAFFSES